MRERAPGPALLALGIVLAMLALACDDAAVPGSRLATTRVLGARVSVGGDAQRTWPRPGEAADVQWIVAGPKPRPLAWAFQVRSCLTTMDDETCASSGAPLPAVMGTSDGTAPPALSVTPAAGSDGIDRLMVTGAICAGGAVADVGAAAWARCTSVATDGGAAVDEADVQLTVHVQSGAEGNAPPSLGDDPMTWDGTAWQTGAGDPSLSSSGQPCAEDPSLPRVTWEEDGEHHVIITTDAADRDSFVPASGGAATAREGAQLSAFATLGSFSTQFGTVPASHATPTDPVRFTWKVPSKTDAALDEQGRLVRFVFVMRDGRGGVDVATRTLCLVPPPAH